MSLHVDWTAQPWGEATDSEIARRLGCAQVTVSDHRRRLGIPRCDTHGINWDAQPLGQVPDPALARQLGLHDHRLVHWHRTRQGIPACCPRPKWTLAEEKVLRMQWGYLEPEAIAALLPGRTAIAVIEHGRDAMRLGSVGVGWLTQLDVLRRLGICWDALRRLRRAAGVKPRRRPHSEKGTARTGRRCRRPWAYTEEQVNRLAEALAKEMSRVAAL